MRYWLFGLHAPLQAIALSEEASRKKKQKLNTKTRRHQDTKKGLMLVAKKKPTSVPSASSAYMVFAAFPEPLKPADLEDVLSPMSSPEVVPGMYGGVNDVAFVEAGWCPVSLQAQDNTEFALETEWAQRVVEQKSDAPSVESFNRRRR